MSPGDGPWGMGRAGARGDEVRHQQQPSTQMGKEKKGQPSSRAGMKVSTEEAKEEWAAAGPAWLSQGEEISCSGFATLSAPSSEQAGAGTHPRQIPGSKQDKHTTHLHPVAFLHKTPALNGE